MVNRIDKRIKNNLLISLFSLVLIIFFSCGCNSFASLKTEAKEERKILGYVQGYNPRIKGIQKILKDTEFYIGPINGTLNKKTRIAIRNFQKANKLKVSGFIDVKTHAKLDATAFKEQKKKLESLKTGEGKDVRKSTPRVKELQLALKKAGFDPGPIDGKLGKNTKQAIIAFQKSKNLSANGRIDQKTWEELMKYQTENN